MIACFVDLTEKRAQEARLRLMVDGAALGTWEFEWPDGTGRFNERWMRMLGYEPGQLEIGPDTWRNLVHPDDLPVAEQRLLAHLEDPSDAYQAEVRMRHRLGHWAWVFTAGRGDRARRRGSTAARRRRAPGHRPHQARRGGDRRSAGARRARARGTARLSDGLDKHAIVAVTDPSGTIKQANDRFCDVSQYSRDELIGQTHRIVLGRSSARILGRHVAPHQQGAQLAWRGLQPGQDGSLYWLDSTVVPVLDNHGRVIEHVAIRTEITQRKQLEEQLRSAALTDSLTQLPNRVSILDKLQGAVLRARRLSDYRFAVLFMDFDRFKLVNDSLGHDAGDELLRQIALRLRTALREGDSMSRLDDCAHTAARIGGDEFVILLDGIRGAEDAELVARRLLLVPPALPDRTARGAFERQHRRRRQRHQPRRRRCAAARRRHRECTRPSGAGRGRYALFDATMHERVARTLGVETDLRRALQNDEFFVAYQPVVDLATGKLRGVEALARWRHPERGLVPPLEFIPIAEETGLIAAIGARVLASACEQFMRWRETMGDAAPASVAVNLSRAQLCQGDLIETVQHELLRTGMQPTGCAWRSPRAWRCRDSGRLPCCTG